MKKKSDWQLVKEAEKAGLVAHMTSKVERGQTGRTHEIGDRFVKALPNYVGSYGEDQYDDVLYSLNTYLTENNIDRHQLDFPMSTGTDVRLVPISENLQLKVLVVDEYYGDGDYSKYVMVDFFLVNEQTTDEEVDALIEFAKEHLLFN